MSLPRTSKGEIDHNLILGHLKPVLVKIRLYLKLSLQKSIIDLQQLQYPMRSGILYTR